MAQNVKDIKKDRLRYTKNTLSSSMTYTNTLSGGQSRFEANSTYFPSSLPASRKSSAGDEYGNPIFTGTDQSDASSSQCET